MSRSVKAQRIIIGAATTLFMVFGASNAGATSLGVMPVRIHFAPGQRDASMTATNPGQRPMSFQVRPFVWSQHHNQNILTPTNNLLVSPPLGIIKAGGRQVIRFALRQMTLKQERTYRILLDEIPPAGAPGTVQIKLRLSIPIFVEPPRPVSAHIHWHIANHTGHDYLVVTNDGTRHQTINKIYLSTANGHKLKVRITDTPYVLAGATRRWLIETSNPLPPGATLWMDVQTDTGHIAKKVRVASHP